MKVELKNIQQIDDLFHVMLPDNLKGGLSFFILLSTGLILTTNHFFNLENPSALSLLLLLSFVVTIVLSAYYIRWLKSSYLRYKLEIVDDELILKGNEGWKKIEKIISIHEVSRICIGDPSDTTKKLPIEFNPLSNRITVITQNGQSFPLEMAAKIFVEKSLVDFFSNLEHFKIDTNFIPSFQA